MGVKEHYDNHLGNIYAWMSGDFASAQSSQQRFFVENDVLPNISKHAFDLGSGHGLQSVSLAKLGFDVVAVDFNHHLLDELTRNTNGLTVSAVEDDILKFLERVTTSAGVMVCMGDTITHLESVRQVEAFIRLSYKKLLPGGKLVLSFRDLAHELVGPQRFIPVRQDANRILTCFLEYAADYVMVHDIIHENVNGTWQQRVGAYPKLRLDQSKVVDMVQRQGFAIRFHETINRMIHLIAVK